MDCALAFQASETGLSPVSRSNNALVVQLVEALALEARCWEFESLQAHHPDLVLLVSTTDCGSVRLGSNPRVRTNLPM